MEDWEIEPDAEEQNNEAVLATLFDDPLKPLPTAVVKKRVRDPAYRSLAVEARALPHRQRIFLRFMVANQMNPRRAIEAMNKALGTAFNARTARLWAADQNFRTVLERHSELALAASGVASTTAIRLRIDDVVEDALKPVPMIYKGHEVVLRDGSTMKEVDRGSALKGLEMLGKAAGAFRADEEDQRRVTVVLDFSGDAAAGETESETIDGEFEAVK